MANNSRKVIAEGNYIRTSYFTVNGCLDVKIGVNETSDDETQVVYEDGLYKAFKNGILLRAATQCLITVEDKLK